MRISDWSSDVCSSDLRREYNVEANVGAPQVAYRETIRKTVEQEGKYAKQSGGKGQFDHVWLRIEPQEPGKGYEFVNDLVGGRSEERRVGKEGSVRVDLGGRSLIKQKNKKQDNR